MFNPEPDSPEPSSQTPRPDAAAGLASPQIAPPPQAAWIGPTGLGPPPLDLLTPPCTDLGNAQRLVALHGPDIRYCHARRTWFVWDGTRWQADSRRQIEAKAANTIRRFRARAEGLAESPARTALLRWANASEASSSLGAMVHLAGAIAPIPVAPEEFDTHPYLLNFQNGTIDLQTGQLLPHTRSHLLTRRIPERYRPSAPCPQFLCFLHQTMAGFGEPTPDAAAAAARMVEWLQIAFGYSLTGMTSEKCIFVLHGERDTGKSTLLTLWTDILTTDYSTTINVKSLMKHNSGSNAARDDIADLEGTRFAMTSETDADDAFSASDIKRLTKGMGVIKTDRKGRSNIQFLETHKLWIDANHRPNVDSDDEAIWIRFRPIPFRHTVPPHLKDFDLPRKLRLEAEGILAWAVAGAAKWCDQHLPAAPEIEEAKAEWRATTDHVGMFLAERCTLGKEQRASNAHFQQLFYEWLDQNHPGVSVTTAQLGRRLAREGFEPTTVRTGEKVLHGWRGFSVDE